MTNSIDKEAELLAFVAIWIAQRQPDKPYRPQHLTDALGKPMRQLAPVLELYGWRKTLVTSSQGGKQVKRIWWAPRDVPLPKPQRGRPSNIDLLTNPARYVPHIQSASLKEPTP